MSRHDQDVPEPTARLARVLALLRALGGPRGDSTAIWHGQGFTYTLTASRDPHGPDRLDVSVDPDAHRLDELLEALREALDVRS